MKKTIHVNSDLTLIQVNSRPRQVQSFLKLLKENEKRIKPYFPGFYTDGINSDLVKELLEHKEKSYQKKEITSYAVCSREKKRIIGEILIYHTLIDASISYWIDKQCEGNGVMSIVFDSVRENLFQNKIHAIFASTDAKNKKSIQLLKNKGLKPVATYKNKNGIKFIDFTQTKNEYLFEKKLTQNFNERTK